MDGYMNERGGVGRKGGREGVYMSSVTSIAFFLLDTETF